MRFLQGLDSFAPIAAAKFLIDFPVAGLLGAGFTASVISQSRNARRNSYSPISVLDSNSTDASTSRALRDPPPSESDAVDTRFASAVDAIAALDRAERRTQGLSTDRMVDQMEKAMSQADSQLPLPPSSRGPTGDRTGNAAAAATEGASGATSTGRSNAAPSREVPSVANPWANRRVAARSSAAIAEAEKEAAAVAAAAQLPEPTCLAPSVESPMPSRFAHNDESDASSGAPDVPTSPGPSSTSFEVTFLSNSLGVSIAEPLPDDPFALPVIAAVDIDIASVRVGKGGSERLAGLGATAAAEWLPKEGDRLESVNGEYLNGRKIGRSGNSDAVDNSSNTTSDLYDAALNRIASAPRPLLLGFVRQDENLGGDTGKLSAAEAEAAAAAEAFFEAVAAADASGGDEILSGEGPREL